MGFFESRKPRKETPREFGLAHKANVDAHLSALRAMEKLAQDVSCPDAAKAMQKAQELVEKGK